MFRNLPLLFTTEFASLPETLQHNIFEEFNRLVYPQVFGILKDYGSTEDVVQESFLRTIQKASQLQNPDKLEGWIKALARSIALNYLRKFARNRGELKTDRLLTGQEDASSGIGAGVYQEVEDRLMLETISHSLGELKPEYRKLIEMRWIHSLSYKEIAAALDVSENTIRQKLFRARERFRSRFREDWDRE